MKNLKLDVNKNVSARKTQNKNEPKSDNHEPTYIESKPRKTLFENFLLKSSLLSGWTKLSSLNYVKKYFNNVNMKMNFIKKADPN